MEEIIDIDQWLAEYIPPPVNFLASFDISTGRILAVGPAHAFNESDHTVSIDQETAEMIIEGRINLDTCSVDVVGDSFVVSETRAVYKIDDVLHRIIDVEHAEFKKPDVYLTADNNSITIELTEEFGGTRKIENAKKKKINWAGNTSMNFFITDYNDPNIVYNVFSVKISDLVGDKVVMLGINMPKKFSVYTRRLFKNYIIEYK